MTTPPSSHRARWLLAVAALALLALLAATALVRLDDDAVGGDAQPAATATPAGQQRPSPTGDPGELADESGATDGADDGDRSANTPTPGDADAAGGSQCQAPALGSAPTGAVVLHQDCIELTLASGGDHRVDGHAILADPPACAAFGLHFSWQVTSTPISSIDFTVTRQGTTQTVASGTTGDGTGLCGVVKATNPAASTATVDVRYRLLDCEPTGGAC